MQQNYYPKEQIEKVYSEPGVYKLFASNKNCLGLVYIGQSLDLRKRLREHSRTVYMEFNYFDFDFYPMEKLDEIERKELDEFKKKNACWPKYNNQAGNRLRSKSKQKFF